MANNTGKKFGGRQAGTPNRVNAPFRETLNKFADNSLTEEEITRLYNSLSDSEKAVFFPKVLPYLTAKMQSLEVTGDVTHGQAQAIIDLIASRHEDTAERD